MGRTVTPSRPRPRGPAVVHGGFRRGAAPPGPYSMAFDVREGGGTVRGSGRHDG